MKRNTACRHVIVLLLASLLSLGLTGCGTKRIDRPADAVRRVSPAIAQKAVKSAQAQIGRPYRLGGDSPQKGFDCSGLVFWAYKQHGVIVPRRTVAQAKVGSKIARHSLKPGDIVVFRAPGAPNGLHTGLYAGENKFIHSPNSKSAVRLETMGPYWLDRYMTGRRVTHTTPRR